MKCSISQRSCQWAVVGQLIAVVGLVLLTHSGQVLESGGGWVACPAQMIGAAAPQKKAKGRVQPAKSWKGALGWAWLKPGWGVAALRSEVLLGLVVLGEQWAWGWVCLLPWLNWLWQGLGLRWPALGRQGWYLWLGWGFNRASGLALVGLGLVWLGQQAGLSQWGSVGAMAVVASLNQAAKPAKVEVVQTAAGIYEVRLQGEFELRVDGQVEMYKRLLIIFLGLLEVAGENRKSRRTRDGRCPFVRQQQMSAWFGVPHPLISRWYGYWLKQDWRRLLSHRWGEVLTAEVQQQVLSCWVKFPWWSAQQLWEHLQAQGSRLTLNQVKQVAQESGWSLLRQELKRVYQLKAESFRPQDEWLTEQLLGQVQHLTEQLAQLGQLPTEQQAQQADLLALRAELNLKPVLPQPPCLWLRRVEELLFGCRTSEPAEAQVRCCYCGTSQIAPKSNKPRLKYYQDEQGQTQSVEVYRYYCHNSACRYGSFTHLPPDLLPHSRFTLKHHLAALQLYEWSHSVYRCTGQWLGVSKMTAYRWVSSFGYELLPVAALFGLVRSSGVVGVDEKYVKVAQPTQ